MCVCVCVFMNVCVCPYRVGVLWNFQLELLFSAFVRTVCACKLVCVEYGHYTVKLFQVFSSCVCLHENVCVCVCVCVCHLPPRSASGRSKSITPVFSLCQLQSVWILSHLSVSLSLSSSLSLCNDREGRWVHSLTITRLNLSLTPVMIHVYPCARRL